MREFMMWLAGKTGQTFCVIVFLLSLAIYVLTIVFDEKWGD